MQHFLEQFSEENGFDAPILEDDALNVLQHYRWPGNVRELRNFLRKPSCAQRGEKIGKYDLDPRFTIGEDETDLTNSEAMANTLSVEENEKRLCVMHLLKAKGNKTKAAELMGISRRTLHRKLALWPELDLNGF